MVAVPIVLGAMGFGYQGIAAEQDRRAYSPPGQFVNIDGTRLHINCTGQGSPTVILESGLGGWSSYWALIQPALAGGVRVCSYDRAGLGWSDPGPQPRDARHIAVELHALLVGADVPGPYVLAAHSNGGLYARMFASLYPEDVAGMMLADATPTDLFDRLPATRASFDMFEQQARTFQWLAPVGMTRLLTGGAMAADLVRFPSPAREEILALYSTSRQWHGAELEVQAMRTSMAQVSQLGGLGARSLMVVTSTEGAASVEQAEIKRAIYTDMARLSSNSRQVVVEGATHTGLTLNPEHAQMTSAAIRQVVDVVRTGQPLAR